jgi:hypothetical protein
MIVPRTHALLISLTFLCIIAEFPVCARPLPDSTYRSDQTDLEAEGQSAPDATGLSRGDGVGARKDSADREMIQLEIARADLEVSSSDIWHRLIPRVSLSAGIGVADLVFIDPSARSSTMLPKDSYRLNVSLSLSDVLDFPKHARALLELEITNARLRKFDADQAVAREAGRRRHESAQGELALFHEELVLIERLVHYNELLFEDGKIAFDVLARSRLQLIGVRKSMLQLQATLSGR